MRSGAFPRSPSLGLILFLAISLPAVLGAQDDFGFGFGDPSSPTGEAGDGSGGDSGGFGAFGGNGASGALGASVHGKARATFQIYGKELSSGDAFKNIHFGDIFSGQLNFSAAGSIAEGIINLNLVPNLKEPAKSLGINEAYIRTFFGPLTLEGGFRKLTWGKADSLGPLDVINPMDYSDLSRMSNLQDIKIARPMIHGSFGFGAFSKLEGVFIPWFEGHHFAQGEGDRWTPLQYRELPDGILNRVLEGLPPELRSDFAGQPMPEIQPPDMGTLEYTQGGIRLTGTLGKADFGAQYYSGFLPRPAAGINRQGIETLEAAVADLRAKKAAAEIKGAAAQQAQTAFTQAEAAYQAAQGAYTRAQAEFSQAQAAAIAATAAYAALGPQATAAERAQAAQAMSAANAAMTARGNGYQTALTDMTTKGTAYQNAGTAYQEAGGDFQTAKEAAEAAGERVKAAGKPENLYTIQYNRFHQLGVDYAQVIRGFNIRAELAAILTGDLSGDDGLVYNPSMAWSLGFDRDLIAGINLNLQINESIRLLHNQVGGDPLYDVEAGTNPTATRLTLVIAKKFFRDELELKATTLWGLEDMDCYVIPAAIWTRGDISLEVSAGIFGGKDRRGELSQYRDNHFYRTVLTYTF